MDVWTRLVSVGVAVVLLAVVIKALGLALRRQRDGLRAARIAASRPRPRACRRCGTAGPPWYPTLQSEPLDGWTCSGCGYDVDASGRWFPGQFEGKKKRVLKALAEAEARATEKRNSDTSDQVQVARPAGAPADERYKSAGE
jgi:hypothetical protein